MADGLIKIQGSTNVGKCVDTINDNFEYLDEKTPAGEDILEQAKAYTNFRADAISASTNEALQARVMKETGKGLSTNDYTNAEKAKLEGIEAGANKTIVDSAWDINSTNPVQNKMIIAALQSQSDALSSSCNALNTSIQSLNKKSIDLDHAKINKEEGKGLSSNDYTDEEKDKLAGIAENANNYVHPEFPTFSSGIYKMQVNNGHVSRAVKAEKADILALGFEDPAAAYLPLTGGTISNADYGESLKVNREPTSSSAALSVIDYLINGNRVGVMGFDLNSKLHIRNSNNSEMAEIDKDGTVSAKYFKQTQSGTLLAENSTSENSLTVTNAEIAKYSQVYMAASWTQQETVNFCDVIPISAIVAGAVFTKQVYTGTRIYTYTVTCTSAGVFTLTQSNSTGTAGTLRLKLYVI